MSRLFGFLSVIIVMGIGMFIYSKQMQSSSAQAGASNPQGAINITGVRSDLMSIASAERRYFAAEGKYVALDDLISTNYVTVARQRPPYSYTVEVESGQLSRRRQPFRGEHRRYALAAFGRRKHGVPQLRIGYRLGFSLWG